MEPKAKYLATCAACKIECAVEESVLTEHEKLYCQHCKGPLAFKYIDERPPVLVEGPKQDTQREILAQMKNLVSVMVHKSSFGSQDQPTSGVPLESLTMFDPTRPLNIQNAELIHDVVKSLVHEAAKAAISRVEIYLRDQIHNSRLQTKSAYDLEDFVRGMLSSQGYNNGGGVFVNIPDHAVSQKVRERMNS